MPDPATLPSAGTTRATAAERSPGRPVRAVVAESAAVPEAGKLDRLRDLAADLEVRARRVAIDAWEDFRASDRYVKGQAAVLVAWILLSALSLGIALRGAPARAGANALAAHARVDRTSLGWGLLVENRSSGPWTACTFSADGAFRHGRALVLAGEKLVLGPAQLLGADGVAIPAAAPRALHVDCREGEVTLELAR